MDAKSTKESPGSTANRLIRGFLLDRVPVFVQLTDLREEVSTANCGKAILAKAYRAGKIRWATNTSNDSAKMQMRQIRKNNTYSST